MRPSKPTAVPLIGPVAVALGVAAFVAVFVAGSGCSNPSEAGGGYPDATIDFTKPDAQADLPPPFMPSSDALPMLRPLPRGLPLPPGVDHPRLILGENAELTGGGLVSCSHQEPPSDNGDRWCVFTTPGTKDRPGSVPGTTRKNAELWVINVSAAARGPVPKCNGGDPGCLQLTTNLWTEFPLGGPGHPFAHAFEGDTLIYYADATSVGDQIHLGPIYAWRPGWSMPRQISSDRGLACYGHPRAAVAVCLNDMKGTAQMPESFEILAGSIDSPAGGVLPSAGRLSPFNGAGDVAWQVAFSRDGRFLAMSSADPDPAVEVLRVIATDKVGSTPPPIVLSDVTSWTIANDDRKIYFYRPEGDTDPDNKSLFAASFPGGGAVTRLAAPVQDYFVVGEGPADDGVGFVAPRGANQRAFGLLRDTTAPDSVVTVFTYRGLLEGLNISRDLRFTGWVDGNLRARVVRTADLTSCDLNGENTSAYDIRFLASAGLVFWNQEAPEDFSRRDSFYMDPDGCKERFRLGQTSEFHYPIGDHGVIFGDEFEANGRTVTLKYAHITRVAGEWRVNPALRIQDHVDPYPLVLVGTDPLIIVLRTKPGGAHESGTYVFGPVPF